METLPTDTGPVEVLHVGEPTLPVNTKVITPVGASALREPVAVAVNVRVPPRVGVPEEESTTVGVATATETVGDEIAPTAL